MTESAKSILVLIAFLLDETGSMESVKASTLLGFDEYLKSLQRRAREKEAEEMLRFSLTLFNSQNTRTIYENVPILQAETLDERTYQPNHMTPLYDAVAAAIHGMDGVVDTSLKAGNAALDVLVVIMTDGLENSSRKYNSTQVSDLITERKKRGWNFVFLGANQDAWHVGEAMGVSASHSMKYQAGQERQSFAYMAEMTGKHFDKRAARMRDGEAANEFFDEPPPADVIDPNDADLQRRNAAQKPPEEPK